MWFSGLHDLGSLSGLICLSLMGGPKGVGGLNGLGVLCGLGCLGGLCGLV